MTTTEAAPVEPSAVLFDSTLTDHLDVLRAHHAELPDGPVRDAVGAALALLELDVAAMRARIVPPTREQLRARGEHALARHRALAAMPAAAPVMPLTAADTAEPAPADTAPATPPADTTDAELAARGELLARTHAVLGGLDVDVSGWPLRRIQLAIINRAHPDYRAGGCDDAELAAELASYSDARIAALCDHALAFQSRRRRARGRDGGGGGAS